MELTFREKRTITNRLKDGFNVSQIAKETQIAYGRVYRFTLRQNPVLTVGRPRKKGN